MTYMYNLKCHPLCRPQFRKVKRRFVVEIRSGEDVHEHSDIDETSLETDVGNIADPNLILSRDLKVLNSIAVVSITDEPGNRF